VVPLRKWMQEITRDDLLIVNPLAFQPPVRLAAAWHQDLLRPGFPAPNALLDRQLTTMSR
jgi:hypothetical protein